MTESYEDVKRWSDNLQRNGVGHVTIKEGTGSYDVTIRTQTSSASLYISHASYFIRNFGVFDLRFHEDIGNAEKWSPINCDKFFVNTLYPTPEELVLFELEIGRPFPFTITEEV